MASEYLKPMLDVGSPRVLNCNVLTRRLLAKDSAAETFFRNKPLNNLVLIKDTIDEASISGRSSIGTKLYFPFNENDIYEGGRTIFAHDKHLERSLIDNFGEGALIKDALDQDFRILSILDGLPSLDPFLLKDVFRNEGISMNEAYFEVSKEFWQEIEIYILQKFEPLIKAAFPDAMSSNDRARKLIEKIWEARDLDVLQPLIIAFRLPKGEELKIFSAWKGVNFYSYQFQRIRPMLIELMTWIKETKMPFATLSAAERTEMKSMLELIKTQLAAEWKLTEGILQDYQDGYDKMFKLKTSSTEFLSFLKNSNKAYWDLGNCLGKSGHATYCWDVMTKRFPDRLLPRDQLLEVIKLLAKIYKTTPKLASGMSW